MPGPQPAPTQLKLLKGVRPARINQNEPKPRAVSARLPQGWGRHMSGPAKTFWNRYSQKLVGLGLLTEVDLDTFQILCELMTERRKLMGLIKKHGYVYMTKDKDGNMLIMKPNPAVEMKNKADSQILKYLCLFGMAPAPRGKISAVGPINLDDDDLD